MGEVFVMKSLELGHRLGLECVALKMFLFVLVGCIPGPGGRPDPGGRDDVATLGLVCACRQVKASLAFVVSKQTHSNQSQDAASARYSPIPSELYIDKDLRPAAKQ